MSFGKVAWILDGLLLAALVVLVLSAVYFSLVMQWTDRRTSESNYCGLPPDERRRFKRRLRRHALLLSPFLGLVARTTRFRFSTGTFHYRGVAGPRGGTCSEASFERAEHYEPRADDLFIVTQMRCGTTWMQHLVFQTLTRGRRDLGQEGVTLNALSPWLESNKTVLVDEAPLLGDGPRARIIKTHLPASLCPFDPEAKYICVLRHPVSCFASCVDFVRNNSRGFEPEFDDCLDWYLSNELMWWGTWADHVDGWWARAEGASNVLFVRFEDMKGDLILVARQVAKFLEVPPLGDDELANIARHCSFDAMRQNADVFEMHPPHLLQMPGRFFVSGKTDRYADISSEVRERIIDACIDELRGKSIPIERFYPDLVAHGESTVLEAE